MRFKREHNERAWLAWHIAALYRQEKLPPLRDLQRGEKKRIMPWQEQLAVVLAFDNRINRNKGQ